MLEPGRTLTLAEKGGAGAELIHAAPGFRLVGTMNPGGDYGKKELSPALSNRFTQVWVPAIEDQAELAAILQARLTGKGPHPNPPPLLYRSPAKATWPLLPGSPGKTPYCTDLGAACSVPHTHKSHTHPIGSVGVVCPAALASHTVSLQEWGSSRS